MGIKGPSWLSTLESFDVVNGVSPDYMHCALLGVTKLLLGLWTDTSRCLRTHHDLHCHILSMDACIETFWTPSEITRKPRGLSQLKHWKGVMITNFKDII